MPHSPKVRERKKNEFLNEWWFRFGHNGQIFQQNLLTIFYITLWFWWNDYSFIFRLCRIWSGRFARGMHSPEPVVVKLLIFFYRNNSKINRCLGSTVVSTSDFWVRESEYKSWGCFSFIVKTSCTKNTMPWTLTWDGQWSANRVPPQR
jgi:hypothetical protein